MTPPYVRPIILQQDVSELPLVLTMPETEEGLFTLTPTIRKYQYSTGDDTPGRPLVRPPGWRQIPEGAMTPTPGSLHGPPGFTPGLGSPALGQDINEIRDLIDQLPADDSEEYLQRLEGCLDQIAAGSILTAYKCLDNLYDDVRAAVKALEEEEKPVPVTTKREEKVEPEEGISPWAIAGGLAAAGLLGYLALK